MSGPLAKVRIIEIEALGPLAFAGMLLADHGAEVIRIARPGAPSPSGDALARSRTIVTLDLKTDEGREAVRQLARTADGFIEGMRPGAAERLGLSPDDLLGLNPRLVYGRLTGWGQTGPNAPRAGHDLNYIALTGALHAIGPADRPMPPLALLGDFAGGGLLLAFGMVSALLHARATGEGQVIDCAMMDGANLLMAIFHGMIAQGSWEDRREANIVDGGAPWYSVYETADGKFISIAAMEPQFYAQLLGLLGLADDPQFVRTEQWFAVRDDKAAWPMQRRRLAEIFLRRTRDEWAAMMEATDACFAPVLSITEAPNHPHALAREAFVAVDGKLQPAPAPRYSRSSLDRPRPAARASTDGWPSDR